MPGLRGTPAVTEKGSLAVKQAHQLLLNAGLNFLGNIEGNDVARGECPAGPIDVVVCDGFVGNVLLKFYETVAPFLVGLAARQSNQNPEQLFKSLRELDYAEYGGAPLLGVRGVSIISHGRSSPRALKNAVLVAKRAVTSQMNAHIGRRLAEGITAGDPE
jgi:glycerol-3-phosphate acyltransferase PlsX